MKATQSQHRMEEIAMARILTRFKEDYSAMLSSTRFECGDACTKRPGDLPVETEQVVLVMRRGSGRRV